MNGHENLIRVMKAANPNKLIVSHATSSKDEIRFYINKTQYYGAKKEGDGFTVEFGDDANKDKESTINKA